MIIEPTVGRVVWFFPAGQTVPKPQAAIVVAVQDDRLVNLGIFNPDGTSFGLTNVVLVQEGDKQYKGTVGHCSWMPYQLITAQKAAGGGSVAKP